MIEGFCISNGPLLLRVLVDRGSDGFAASNGRRRIVDDHERDEVLAGIDAEGLGTYLRERFSRVVQDVGIATYGPDFRPDDVMRDLLTADLADRVADAITAWERAAV